MRIQSGKALLALSITSRLGVLLLLFFFAFMTDYLNYKQAYDNPRLVELSSGKTVRIFYEATDTIFSWFGDPLEVAQSNGGMTWSIRVMGVPFTDPIAALSVLLKSGGWSLGFGLGLIVPVGSALFFGRIFCSYICPASLLFFTISRMRRNLERWLLFPDWQVSRGLAWGILIGGLILASVTGHGIWSLILPYFAIGQTIFHGVAMGVLSIAVGSLVIFAVLDLVLGRQFTCRYICPTGRLLGFMGQKSVVTIRREAALCLSSCTSCTVVCPLSVNPKIDQTRDCSLCGECVAICPTKALSIGLRGQGKEGVS